jgi:hypothetical protein
VELDKKVEGVRLLLGSLNDPYPTLRSALRPDSGPAASKYLPCETCHGTGAARARSGFVFCLLCDGTGQRRRRHGDPKWDAYLHLPLEDAASLPREPSVRRAREPEPPGEEAYGWERQLRIQDRQGSYPELRRHLDWLRGDRPRRHYLIQVVLIEQLPREVTDRAQLEIDLGVVSLALRMRSVRVPRWLRETVPRPVDTVAALAASGLQAGEIARMLGMTKKAVRRQLKRVDSAAAGVPARAT